MKKEIYYEDLDGLGPIPYITIKKVPVYHSEKLGPVIDVPIAELELIVARAIVQNNQIPLHGRELKMIRSALFLSYEAFGRLLEVTHATVRNWEKGLDVRLDAVTEIAVRALAAEKLGVEIPGTLSALRAKNDQPPAVVVKYKKGA